MSTTTKIETPDERVARLEKELTEARADAERAKRYGMLTAEKVIDVWQAVDGDGPRYVVWFRHLKDGSGQVCATKDIRSHLPYLRDCVAYAIDTGRDELREELARAFEQGDREHYYTNEIAARIRGTA